MIEIFKALGDENRLRILNILTHQTLCVCELEVMLDMSQSNVSRHLGKLKSAGIIESNKEALWVRHVVSDAFKQENENLYLYIVKSFKTDPQYAKDIERLNRYRKNKLTCQMITDNKIEVLSQLKDI